MGKVIVKPTDEKQKEVRERLEGSVRRFLDMSARDLGYDNILSLCTYATSKNSKYQAEGQSAVEWRDDVWSEFYKMLSKVNKGKLEESNVIEKLPKAPWT